MQVVQFWGSAKMRAHFYAILSVDVMVNASLLSHLYMLFIMRLLCLMAVGSYSKFVSFCLASSSLLYTGFFFFGWGGVLKKA